MIVIVLGMHRSGTSAISGILHENGINMGKVLYPPPMKENPKGFYESKHFRDINDRILNFNAYKVKAFSPNIPDPIHLQLGHTELMQSRLREYSDEFENWGWKDPRTSLLIEHWLEIMKQMNLFDQVKMIYMHRNPRDIAQSMKNRGNKEKTPGQFVKVAIAYQEACVPKLLLHKDKTCFIAFEYLMVYPERELKKVSDFLGYDLKDISFVDPLIPKTRGQNNEGSFIPENAAASQ